MQLFSSELERKLLEEKNAAQELKRKSEHLDSFIHQIPVEKRPKRQMMKLLRQKAVNESTLPRGPGGLVACELDKRGDFKINFFKFNLTGMVKFSGI